MKKANIRKIIILMTLFLAVIMVSVKTDAAQYTRVLNGSGSGDITSMRAVIKGSKNTEVLKNIKFITQNKKLLEIDGRKGGVNWLTGTSGVYCSWNGDNHNLISGVAIKRIT